jgi:hypothetical protein
LLKLHALQPQLKHIIFEPEAHRLEDQFGRKEKDHSESGLSWVK